MWVDAEATKKQEEAAKQAEAEAEAELAAQEQQKRERQERRSLARSGSYRNASASASGSTVAAAEAAPLAPTSPAPRFRAATTGQTTTPTTATTEPGGHQEETTAKPQRSKTLGFSAAPALVGPEGQSYRLSRRTAWVGNLPLYLARDEQQLRQVMQRFGTVDSLTVTIKDNGESCYSSWCLVCFAELSMLQAILAAPPLMVPVEPQAKEGEPTEGTVELKVAAERDTRNNRTSSEKADLEAAREQLLKSDSVRATGTMSGKKHWKNARSMYLVTQAMRSKTRRAAGAEPTPHAAGGVFQSIGGAQDRSTHAVTMMLSEIIDRLDAMEDKVEEMKDEMDQREDAAYAQHESLLAALDNISTRIGAPTSL
jgi:hypothetical protein